MTTVDCGSVKSTLSRVTLSREQVGLQTVSREQVNEQTWAPGRAVKAENESRQFSFLSREQAMASREQSMGSSL